MILGGSGLVGHAVVRRLLDAAPRRIVLVAQFEDEVKATVAYEMLGPPRLTKLLWESHLCGLLRPSVRAAESHAPALAAEAVGRVERDPMLRSHILSVGIPILTPDGARLYRGSVVAVPADSGSDVAWTAIGADEPIEPARFVTWVFRFEDRGERIKR